MKWLQYMTVVLLSVWGSALYGQQSNEDFWKPWHYHLTLGIDAGDTQVSPTAGLRVWYFVNPRLGIGPALQYTEYELSFETRVLQTGGGVVFRQPIGGRWNAIASMEGGYGHPYVDNAVEKSGGVYYLPSAGFVFNTNRNGMSLTLGYLRQPWEMSTVEFFPNATVTEVVVKRYRISFGLVF